MICFLQDRWFPDLASRMQRVDLVEDPRFKDEESKFANGAALIEELQRTFATRTLEEWNAILFGADGVWAPVQSPAEVLKDEQALVNSFVTPVTDDDGDTYLSAASPCQFDQRPIGSAKVEVRPMDSTVMK